MYKEGHIGLGLLAATPFALLFGFTVAPQWGLLTFGFAFVTSRAPDIDQRLPGISHRGFTHTIWFGVLLSIFFGAGATVALVPIVMDAHSLRGGISLVQLLTTNWSILMIGFTGCLAGFVSHLFGDILTEAYDYTVNPFWPVSGKAYTLGWTKADSKVWNWGFLLLGGAATIGTVTIL
jgi:inner membrane protein